MVLSLKRRKSRSSPGFAGGVREVEPIHIVFDGPLPDPPSGGLVDFGRAASLRPVIAPGRGATGMVQAICREGLMPQESDSIGKASLGGSIMAEIGANGAGGCV